MRGKSKGKGLPSPKQSVFMYVAYSAVSHRESCWYSFVRVYSTGKHPPPPLALRIYYRSPHRGQSRFRIINPHFLSGMCAALHITQLEKSMQGCKIYTTSTTESMPVGVYPGSSKKGGGQKVLRCHPMQLTLLELRLRGWVGRANQAQRQIKRYLPKTQDFVLFLQPVERPEIIMKKREVMAGQVFGIHNKVC